MQYRNSLFVVVTLWLIVSCAQQEEVQNSNPGWSGPLLKINDTFGIYKNQEGQIGLASLDDPSPAFGAVNAGPLGAADSAESDSIRGAVSDESDLVITHASANTVVVAMEINSQASQSSDIKQALQSGSQSLQLGVSANYTPGPSPKPGSKEYCELICAQNAKIGQPCKENLCTFANCQARWCDNTGLPKPSCAYNCTGYDCHSLPRLKAAEKRDELAEIAAKCRKNARIGESFRLCDLPQQRGLYQLCDRLLCEEYACEGRPIPASDEGGGACPSFWPGYVRDGWIDFRKKPGVNPPQYKDEYPMDACRAEQRSALPGR